LSGAGGCAALIALAVASPLLILGWMFATAAAIPLWLLLVLGVPHEWLRYNPETMRVRDGDEPPG
jgi:hypothetical protein